MTKTVQHISLKKSTIVGKVPAKDVLAEGELAVNYGEGGEKIFLQNTKKDIVEFSADKLLDKKYLSTTSGGTVSGDTEFKGDVKIVYPDSTSQTVSLREVMLENEKVTSAALNDLNERNDELSAKVTEQKTDIDNLSQKYLPLSGGTVTGDTTFTKDVKVVFPNSETPTSLVGAIVSNEKVISAALNNLNERVDDHKSDIDNLKAQKNLPLSGGTVTGEATFSGGLKFRYPDVSSTPVSLRDVIADNEEVTAAALNDLNDKINKIGDISIANGVLIINDGNTKYKLNLEKLVTDGYAIKE